MKRWYSYNVALVIDILSAEHTAKFLYSLEMDSSSSFEEMLLVVINNGHINFLVAIKVSFRTLEILDSVEQNIGLQRKTFVEMS